MNRAGPEEPQRGESRAARKQLRRSLALAALAALVFAAWRTDSWLDHDDEGDPDPIPGGGNRSMESRVRTLAEARGRGAWIPPPRLDGAVTISGAVIDAATHEGVGGVEVVFRGDAGEETTTAEPDGKYRIDLPLGSYRAFVRDDTVLSVGHADRVRLPGLPTAEAAGAPDEALMPVIVASADAGGVDLTVTRGGVVRGKVLDRAGHPIASAVLRARSGGLRPALGTDVAETGTDGAFELRLPAGTYDVEVSHARFAGIAGPQEERRLAIAPGEVQAATFTLVAGCVIAGRVVGPSGRPAGDGAIEQRWGSHDSEFAPAGRIEADGTFRWTTTDEAEIVLRAWPWKSPPSEPQTFACRDGARHDGVVFSLPNRGPDLDGVLVDRGGAPVPLAFIDLISLDGGSGQQERTDEQGRWSVYQLPEGRYQVTAYAAGRGVLATVIEAPQAHVRLQLGGTGRLEGKTPLLASGSFELGFSRCSGDDTRMRLPPERRLVMVTDHAFTVEGVPACDLEFFAIWRGRTTRGSVEVTADATASVELDVGPPHAKVARGTVTDDAGRPVEGVTVKALFEHEEPAVTTTDTAGRYTLNTFAGAELLGLKRTDDGALYGADGQVGRDGGDETIDLQLSILRSAHEPVDEDE
jgi:hypothetical protein